MLNSIRSYNFKVRDALILSLVIHFLLVLIIREKKDEVLLSKDLWDTKPVKFIFPDSPSEDVEPSKDVPYSDADRISKSPEPNEIVDKVNPKRKGLSQIEVKPQIQAGVKEYGDTPEDPSREISREDSLIATENKEKSETSGPTKQELLTNPSKYINGEELYTRQEGGIKRFDDIEFLETMKHPCWGSYPRRIQEIVRNRMVIPIHLLYTKAITVLRFRLFKNGDIEELSIFRSTGNKALDKIAYHAIDGSDFPQYPCPYPSVNVQYTFYLGFEPDEVEYVGSY